MNVTCNNGGIKYFWKEYFIEIKKDNTLTTHIQNTQIR